MPKMWDEDWRTQVEQLTVEDPGLSALTIHQRLLRERRRDHPAASDQDLKKQVPSARTITDWMREARADDRTGPWTLATVRDPADNKLVAETLNYLIKRTDGRVRGMSKAEAWWLVRILHVHRDMDWLHAYTFARRYAARERAREPYARVDELVVTYQDPEAREALQKRPKLKQPRRPVPEPVVATGMRTVRGPDPEWESVKDLKPGDRLPERKDDDAEA